jgi:S-adenosylmethionine hydrolase
MSRPVITFLTDFGARDPSAAIVRGVILSIAPDVTLIDISHEVRKFAVRDGAVLLWCALPYLPVGICVAVVDPGVGSDRRPIAVRTARGDTLIGPDNGLLLPAAERLGGVTEARLLANPDLRLPTVSASFHGRDIFAPAAAHLAMGVPFEALGPALDPADLVRLPWPGARAGDGWLETAVLYVDTFGNVKLGALANDFGQAFGRPTDRAGLQLAIAGRVVGVIRWADSFADVSPGEPLVYLDSYERLCLAVNQGSAASRFGIAEDVAVTIRRVG